MNFGGRLWWMAALGLMLSACGGEPEELAADLREVLQRPPAAIEPLPAPYPTVGFSYAAQRLRNPFLPAVAEAQGGRYRGLRGEGPDLSRQKQFLEGFGLEQFVMVGTLANANRAYVLLKGAGGVHRLAVGDYLGLNHGRISAISDREVDVLELIPEGNGSWLTRPQTLTLTVHSPRETPQ